MTVILPGSPNLGNFLLAEVKAGWKQLLCFWPIWVIASQLASLAHIFMREPSCAICRYFYNRMAGEGWFFNSFACPGNAPTWSVRVSAAHTLDQTSRNDPYFFLYLYLYVSNTIITKVACMTLDHYCTSQSETKDRCSKVVFTMMISCSWQLGCMARIGCFFFCTQSIGTELPSRHRLRAAYILEFSD